jgi:CheY-like chemotaxis protein
VAKSSLIILTTSRPNAERLKKDLSGAFDLIFTQSGAQTLQSIQQKLPAAVVMDHSLEDYLTYRFIDKVRNNPVTRNLPFILVSRESSQSFVDQAVRSGVAHYIGIPYEREVLLEKIKTALNPETHSGGKRYFTLATSLETSVVSYGRISFISEEGIHFETRLRLEPDQEVHFKSPLAEAIGEPHLVVRISQIGTDVFYNYPFAVDALWADPNIAKKVKSWIFANRHLNSPKKSKILFISSDLTFEGNFMRALDKSHYSARFESSLDAGIRAIPYLCPAVIVVDSAIWKGAGIAHRDQFLKKLTVPWIVFGPEAIEGDLPSKPFESPPDVSAIASAVLQVSPPKAPEASRIYFSKTLEDSRLRIFFKGKIVTLAESGATVLLEHDVVPPCNFHLDLKIFDNQNLRNPYIRVWPPAKKIAPKDSENGKYKVTCQSHFLGVNDDQASAIRQWLRDEELREQRKLIADVPPKPLV